MVLPQDFEQRMGHIGRLRDPILQVHHALWEAEGGGRGPRELLLAAVAGRALSLCDGYVALARLGHYTTSMCLVRLQLDSCLRLYAGELVEDRGALVGRIAEGGRLDQMRDKRGKFMRDRYLMEQLAKEYIWVETIYETTSGFVHFSGDHVALISAGLPQPDHGVVPIPVGGPEEGASERDWYGSAVSFQASTWLCERLLRDWLRDGSP